MKTFYFYNQSEQEDGDELGQEGAEGQKMELVLPDGFDLKRDNSTVEDYTYTVTQNGQDFFKFTILPVVQIPNMPMPAAVILRAKGDKEGTL